MLVELRIRDYAVVEDLTLELGPGLNALTGETGAGKSIIVGALSLLLGERASSDVVRVGAERATVEAVFEVDGLPAVKRLTDEHGFRLEDGLLILRREVASAGRNRAWVCGSPATAGIVGALGTALVDLHGQHEHQTLLRSRDQRAILDAYGGSQDLATSVGEEYERLQALRRDLEGREERRREVESRADFLRFQLAEIDEADLAPGEDESLESEAGRHQHSEELARGAAEVHARLYEGEGGTGEGAISDLLADVGHALQRLADFDPGLRTDLERLTEARHIIDDLGSRMGDYASAVDHDPERLEEVRVRLDRIFRLKRKYGPELADVLATAQRVRNELADLDDADHDLDRIRAQMQATEADLTRIAADLTAARSAATARLSAAMADVLPDLGLGGALFTIALSSHDTVSAGGAESVEFRVAPNEGFEPMPLARIASGGELSRIMLGLKSILATVDRVPVLIFDEIDAGVGGVVATAVAGKLAEVAERHQVFVVTHLPQVASHANAHLLVEKESQDGITKTTVRTLKGDDRIEEVARMLGGDPESQASRDHARELLEGVGRG
ncbi:MAG: DNA repair protein RecN [Deltaproteobacteria bacterium]|nr:DNA repair protein RecN [Deltaproteobacteria bacterium]